MLQDSLVVEIFQTEQDDLNNVNPPLNAFFMMYENKKKTVLLYKHL